MIDDSIDIDAINVERDQRRFDAIDIDAAIDP